MGGSVMCPDDDIRDEIATESDVSDASPFLAPESVRAWLETLPTGLMFSVSFLKRDGKRRDMTARRGVVSALRGGESTIREHANLISVYDMQASGYRCFDVARVYALRSGARTLGAVPGIRRTLPGTRR